MRQGTAFPQNFVKQMPAVLPNWFPLYVLVACATIQANAESTEGFRRQEATPPLARPGSSAPCGNTVCATLRIGVVLMADQADPKKPASGNHGVSRGPSPIKQRDIARALRAVRQTGVAARLEITRGGINIILADEQAPSSDTNPWDEDLTDAENPDRPS